MDPQKTMCLHLGITVRCSMTASEDRGLLAVRHRLLKFGLNETQLYRIGRGVAR